MTMTAIEQAIKEAVEKGGWKSTELLRPNAYYEISGITRAQGNTIGIWFYWTELDARKNPFRRSFRRSEELLFGEIFLDPLFWQALGKARGWVGEKIRMCVGCGVALKWNEQPDMEGRHNLQRNGKQVGCGSDIIEYEGQWLIEWHRFIDHLAEGKDTESFFATLI